MASGGFQGLVDGACGTANPLMRLTTHFTEDKARTDIQSSRGHRASENGGQYQSGQLDFADEFLSQQRQPVNSSLGPINSFNMKSLMRELEQPMKQEAISDAWGQEFLQSYPQLSGAKPKIGSHGQVGSKYQQPALGVSDSRWASEYLEDFDTNISTTSAAKDLHDVMNRDAKFSKSEFKSFLKNFHENPTLETGTEWAKEFLESGETTSGRMADSGSTWANEFSEFTDADFEKFLEGQKESVTSSESAYGPDFWDNLNKQWESAQASGQDDDVGQAWADDFSAKNYDEYVFRDDNPLRDTKDCLETGKLKLAEGDLPSAVLLFEAAAQQQPDNPEVWFLLGTSQAKNEQDIAAISALKKSLSIDPTNSDAILALAASLTNESSQVDACHALKDWINSNPKYNSGSMPTSLETLTRKVVSSFMTREQHKETMDLYLRAARINHQHGEIDPDVQSGLGILFNLSGDYDKAVDCFKAALNAKPDDLLLWNRLGATLANGNRSEEAISAYHEALRLYPGFVRSRYNLGISCLNLKAYREAVEHFLTALNFQAAGRGPDDSTSGQGGAMSDNIWGSLRIGLSLLGKSDLYKHVESRNLVALNQEFSMPQS